ncbi:hypothetical protein GOBAR_DD34883 [Gossypium barbadense]|nr:hypothetical protein GOBAR_DD34883 [Gossypium barbadense]
MFLGCDCLGYIKYFDTHFTNFTGGVETIENCACLHEEGHGILWKHQDWRTGLAEVRQSRRLTVRREKISKRMKYLQDLVPGCNKITDKAGMLNEIINYVQSLQRQVESALRIP